MADLRIPNINRIQVSGRITKDLELKYTPAGTPVLSFGIATDRSWKDQGGEWQKETTFINCQAWKNTAEYLIKNAKKGSAVIVEGRLNCRKYNTPDGVEKQIWEIVVEQLHVLEWMPKSDSPAVEAIPDPTDDMPF